MSHYLLFLFLFLNSCTNSKSNLKDFSSYEIVNSSIIIKSTEDAKMRLDLYSEDVVRVWIAPDGKLEKEPSYAVFDESFYFREYKVEDQDEYLQIVTKRLKIKVSKKNLKVDFYTVDDIPISLDQENLSGSDKNLTIKRKLELNEHFYGLGQDNKEYLGTLDRRGTVRTLWAGQEINSGKVTAEVPIPFFMSTNGYGLFFDNTYKTKIDLGFSSDKYYSWSAEGGEAIYYFMYGPSFKHILEKYTDLTGRPSLPPRWVFGYMQSKCTYRTWSEIDNVINTLKDKKFPFDSMVFDFDWAENFQNFKWNERWNGESPSKIKEYEAKDIKFILSQSGPMIRKDSSNYNDALSNDVFARDQKGNTVVAGYYFGDLLDFTASNIKNWLWSQIKPLYHTGIKGWWLDLNEPEGEPSDTKYKDGDAEKIHNVYGLLNTKTYYDMLTENKPDERVFLLSRTGFSGIQRYGATIWTGDIYSDYATFAAQIPALLNMGLSGLPMWSNDSGGFLTGYYKDNLEDHGKLYERWMQFSAFVPMPRAHHVGLSEPYAFGDSVEKSSREYLQLRYSLLPYIYSYASIMHKTGLPIVRPLILEYQDDTQVFNIKDEFLLGERILVAPVIQENVNSRWVYLPEGNWYDFYSSKKYIGKNWYEVEAPQNIIPIFIKSGSIIPRILGLMNTDQKWETLTLDVYPDVNSSFTMYWDDGKTNSSQFTEIYFKLENGILSVESNNDIFLPKYLNVIIHSEQSHEGHHISRRFGDTPFSIDLISQ